MTGLHSIVLHHQWMALVRHTSSGPSTAVRRRLLPAEQAPLVVGVALLRVLVGVDEPDFVGPGRCHGRDLRASSSLQGSDLVGDQIEIGQVRPANYPLSAEIRNVVLDHVDAVAGIEVISMARYATSPEAGALITCTGAPCTAPDCASAAFAAA